MCIRDSPPIEPEPSRTPRRSYPGLPCIVGCSVPASTTPAHSPSLADWPFPHPAPPLAGSPTRLPPRSTALSPLGDSQRLAVATSLSPLPFFAPCETPPLSNEPRTNSPPDEESLRRTPLGLSTASTPMRPVRLAVSAPKLESPTASVSPCGIRPSERAAGLASLDGHRHAPTLPARCVWSSHPHRPPMFRSPEWSASIRAASAAALPAVLPAAFLLPIRRTHPLVW